MPATTSTTGVRSSPTRWWSTAAPGRTPGSPWPPATAPPSADLDGAPFEGRLYADLTAMVAELDLGLCQFGNLPDPGPPGFVFGFQYTAARPGCPARRVR